MYNHTLRGQSLYKGQTAKFILCPTCPLFGGSTVRLHALYFIHFAPFFFVQNYQSTFYQTSGETEADEDEEKLLPLPINVHPSSIKDRRGSNSSGAIFPRSTPLSPNSFQASPWLRTLPSQSLNIKSPGQSSSSSSSATLKTATQS